MTSGRTRQVRLIDIAGGESEPGAGGAGGLLLSIDAAGHVMAARVPGQAGLHDLVAGALETYTLSDSSMAEALAAAVQAAAGQAAWAPAAAQGCDAGEPEGPALTARESEVLRLVARGLTNEAVAEALGISERTARYHLSRIYRRLGTRGRSQAIAWAVRRGLERQ